MKMRLLLSLAIMVYGVSLLGQSVTNELAQRGTWALDYPVGATVFDANGSSVFAVQTGEQKVLQLSLENGEVLKAYDLSREAGAMVLSPDNSRLYVALPSTTGGTDGRIAVIDTAQRTKLRELDIDLSPSDLVATDKGIVFVSGYQLPDSGPNLGAYDSVTGVRLGTNSALIAVGLALSTNQTVVYAGDYEYIRKYSLDPTTGSITYRGVSPQQNLPVAIEYRIFAHPDGVHVLSRGGRICEDLNLGRILQKVYRFESVAFDLTRHAFFAVAVSRYNPADAWLMQYHSETFELGTQFPIDPLTSFVGVQGGDFFLLAVHTNNTICTRFSHPALEGETNRNPCADFEWLPDAPATFVPIQFDGSVSTDEEPGTLSYRWDWDNDGSYDTDWSRVPVTNHCFNIAGQTVVALQVKDRFGALHRVEKNFSVQQGMDFGVPAETNVAYSLPFAAADVAFDPARPAAYFADAARKRLVRVNLETGLAERDYWLQSIPTNLMVSPDGRFLYGSLLVRPLPAIGTPTSYVTRFDLQLGARIFDFFLSFEPLALLPTDLDVLMASGGSEVSTYQISTGLRFWKTNRCIVTTPSLHASQTNIYDAGSGFYTRPGHFSLDPASGVVSNLWNFTSSPDWGGRCFVDPRGANLLTRSGFAFSTSIIKSNDMVPWKRYFTGAVESVAFDVPRQSLFALATPTGTKKTNLYHFNSDSLELVSTSSVSNGTRYVMAYSQHVYTVAVQPNGTFIYRFPHPSSGGETNYPPVARLVISPANPTTLAPVLFDATGSTDDLDTNEQLLYRWDWNGDGVFDTAFANVATNLHHFNIAGSTTVILEVKDRFGATADITNSFEVLLVEDPGYVPDQPNSPFVLPFAADDMVFEKARPYAYAADAAGRRLAKIDLNSGQIERYFDFDYYPALLSMAADGSNLYVGTLLVSNQTVNPKPSKGFIACFDVRRNLKLHEFQVPVHPYSIGAVGSNHLAICTAPAGGYAVYDTLQGQSLSFSPPYLYGGVVAEPGQTGILYATYGTVGMFAVDPATGALYDSTYTACQGSSGATGKVFPIPGTLLAVTRGAGVFQYSLHPSNHIEWVRNLLPVSIESLSADPTRPAFFTVGDAADGSSALVYYGLHSLEPAAVYQRTNRLRFVHATSETLYLVSTAGQTSWIERMANPSVGSETNQAPVADFAWTPGEFRAGGIVHLDGSGSHDDIDSSAQLWYRWDWTDDGVFDSPFTNSPTLDLPLPEAGTFAVTLEVHDRFGSTARVRKTIAVLPASGIDATYGLQFGTGAAAFDRQRPVLYVTDPKKGRLIWLNLETAQIEHELVFDRPLGPLALHPVDDQLFLALMGSPSNTNAELAATIVRIDLGSRSATRQFDINVDPYDMVISVNGYLVASPASGQWVNTRAYRLTTGQETGAVFLRHRCKLAMHPAGSAVYLADTDVNPPGMVKCSLDPVTGALATVGSGPGPNCNLFMDPEGKYLLLGNGAAVTALSGSQTDMSTICQLTNATLHAATFDLQHHAVFASGYLWEDISMTSRLFQFRADTLAPVADHPCTAGTQWFHVSGQYLYGVVPQSDHTVVWRQINPATVMRFQQPLKTVSGRFETTLQGTPGNSFVISTSVDLVKWQPILTNTLQDATWVFSTPTNSEPLRYYRVQIMAP